MNNENITINIVLKNKENNSSVSKDFYCGACNKNSYCQGSKNCTVIKHLCMMEPQSEKTENNNTLTLEIPAYNKYAFRRMNNQIINVIKVHSR